MKIIEQYKATCKPNDNFIWWMYRKIMNHFPIYVKLQKKKNNEQYKSYGEEYPDNIFYVIRSGGESWGLVSLYSHVMWGLKYATEHNYIPVVDFKNYKNMYRKKLPPFENSWEKFFVQPQEYNLNDIRKAKNVVIGQKVYQNPIMGPFTCDFLDVYLKYIQMIKFNDTTRKYIEEEYTNLIVNKKNSGGVLPRVLGVLGRGTDYTTLQPHKHAIVPSADELIAKTDELMDEWGCFDYIFLATEDEFILQCFRNYYGNRLIVNEQERYEHDTKGRVLSQIKTKNDLYKKGLQYLSAIYILSKCDSLIAPAVGGSKAAFWMNENKYEHVYIFDMGCYE